MSADAAAPPLSRAADEARNRSRPPLTDGWRALNDRHQGEDVYILGASPQLARLTQDQLEGLGAAVVIGGNRTYYKAPLTYLLSAYPPEIAIAGRHLDEGRLIHIKKPHQPPLNGRIVSLTRRPYCAGLGLSRHLSEPVPTLYTRRNQALAMLHLAIVMGARRVIFIGVDQSSYAYFWQYDESVRERMRSDYLDLRSDPSAARDVRSHAELSLQMLDQPAREREAMPYYEDFAPILGEYVGQARAFGVEVVATLPGSVVHRAGAALASVDACLSGQAVRRPARRKAGAGALAALAGGLAGRLGGASPSPFAAGYEPPLLISGLEEEARTLAQALGRCGVRVGGAAEWRDPAMSAMQAFAGGAAPFLNYEPSWDFPEAAVEALEQRDELALQAVAAVRRAFLAPGLAADLLAGRKVEGPAPTLWTLQQPWGWRSRFDVALMQALDFIFPGVRLVHVRAEEARAADAFAQAFRAAGAAPPGAEVRQMQIVNLAAAGPAAPEQRFTRRCAERTGALGLVQAYERIAQAAARRLGRARALVLDPQDVRADPTSTAAKVMRRLVTIRDDRSAAPRGKDPGLTS